MTRMRAIMMTLLLPQMRKTTSAGAIKPNQKINPQPLKPAVVMERWQKGRQHNNR
jgi:hypothetical protein